MPPKKNPAVPGAEQAKDQGTSESEGGTTFEESMKTAGFTDKSVAILRENDFSSVGSLKLLAQDSSALSELGFTIQQRLLMKQYLAVNAKIAASEETTPIPVVDLTTAGPGAPLQGFLQAAQQATHVTTGAQHTGTINDPQVYLMKGGCSSKSKYRDIVDFVNLVPPLVEEKVIYGENGVEMLLRSGSRRPQLENISVEEWCLANTRIMHEMLEEGELNMNSIKDYMAYTVKVCDLFKRFDKVSVIAYDREYRYLQSVYEFRWATDAPHLHTTRLRAKAYSYTGAQKSAGRKFAGKEVCRLYNSAGGCTYGDNCKYAHKCNEPGCSKIHSRAQAHVSNPGRE